MIGQGQDFGEKAEMGDPSLQEREGFRVGDIATHNGLSIRIIQFDPHKAENAWVVPANTLEEDDLATTAESVPIAELTKEKE